MKEEGRVSPAPLLERIGISWFGSVFIERFCKLTRLIFVIILHRPALEHLMVFHQQVMGR